MINPIKLIPVKVAIALFGAHAAVPPITLEVDATQSTRGIFHSRLVFPAQPGPLTLTYPRWVPGEHSPFGPIQQLTGLKFSAGSTAVSWRRDPVDLFAFHLTVPTGVTSLEAEFDY